MMLRFPFPLHAPSFIIPLSAAAAGGIDLT